MKPPLERKKCKHLMLLAKKENPRYGKKESVNSHEI
jgi:hypothetical protein